MGNPFYDALDDAFRGQRVRVQTREQTYEGWARFWHYDKQGVLLYDATQADGTTFGAVMVTEPQAVERVQSTGSIEAVAVETIADSPYAVREITDADHQQFVREVNERGHLLSYPTVRSQSESADEYEVISGHRRVAAARRAALDTLPVRIVDLDDWAATRRFVQAHIPLPAKRETGNEQGSWYTSEEIERALTALRADWADEQLADLDALAPELACDDQC